LIPVRKCVGCGGRSEKGELIRVTRAGVDLTGKTPGRGAYLHKDAECVKKAKKKRSLERGLKTQVPEDVWREIERGLTQSVYAEKPES